MRAILLPQAGFPRVLDVRDELQEWYKLVGEPIQIVRVGHTAAFGEVALVCDDEGRMKKKAPNPWTNLIFRRADFVGDVVLVKLRAPEFGSLDEAAANALVLQCERMYEPAMTFMTWEDGVRAGVFAPPGGA